VTEVQARVTQVEASTSAVSVEGVYIAAEDPDMQCALVVTLYLGVKVI